jgi:hypothetical protein
MSGALPSHHGMIKKLIDEHLRDTRMRHARHYYRHAQHLRFALAAFKRY